MWINAGTEKKFSADWSAGIGTELRTEHKREYIDRWKLDIHSMYRIHQYFKFGAAYEFHIKNQMTGGETEMSQVWAFPLIGKRRKPKGLLGWHDGLTKSKEYQMMELFDEENAYTALADQWENYGTLRSTFGRLHVTRGHHCHIWRS